jgi:hypothetical protein
MAAIITTIKGKVLIQIPGSEPVEVGEVEIPIHASTSSLPKTRGREVGTAHVAIPVPISREAACTCDGRGRPCTTCATADGAQS